MDIPRAFISYSHDDDGHQAWVLELVSELHKDYGINAIVDVWDAKLGADLGRYMETLTQTDKVLLICTEEYVRKCNETNNTGVAYEKRLMTARLMEDVSAETFIPVIRHNLEGQMPNFLGALKYLDMNDDELFQMNVRKLAAEIHGVELAKPAIGKNPFIQGLNIDFGTDGISVFPWNNFSAQRLFPINDKLIVTGLIDGKPHIVSVDALGDIELNFADEGLLKLENEVSHGHGNEDFIVNGIYPTEDEILVVPRFDAGNAQKICPVYNYDGDVIRNENFTLDGLHGVLVGERSELLGGLGSPSSMLILDERRQPMLDFNNTGYVELNWPDDVAPNWMRVARFGGELFAFTSNYRNGRAAVVFKFRSNGEIEADFGDGGCANIERLVSFLKVTDVAQNDDGRIYVAGYGNEANLVRLNADGQIDETFGDNGLIQFRANYRSTFERIIVQEGMLYAVGHEASGNEFHNVFVARFYLDGRPDTTFYGDGFYSLNIKGKNEFRDARITAEDITLLCQSDTDAPMHNKAALAKLRI